MSICYHSRMMKNISFAPFLTLDYIVNEHENKVFDRKSAQVRPADVGELISAFANADGGSIVIGISDTKRVLEGIKHISREKLNLLISAPKDCCKPTPRHEVEYIDITNSKGEADQLLILHIEAEPERIISTQNDSVFVRMADKTREVKGDDLRMLEYKKGLRRYEDECSTDATLEDLDTALLTQYKDKLNATDLSDREVLAARGFIKKGKLTNAAVLLFSRHVLQFFPHCRLRVTRYDGTKMECGLKTNIIKDVNFDLPIPRLIQKSQEFISSILREFTRLNPSTNLFETTPEYPEFAWKELIVNAITHREYSQEGVYIQVNIFEDRLEVISPGALPSSVTVENMLFTRSSRNPRIARALTDLGWVRELNEGIKRIFHDMEDAMLQKPVFKEPDNRNVKAVLHNSIAIRTLRSQVSAIQVVSKETWDNLDQMEREILVILTTHTEASTKVLTEYTKRSAPTIHKRLKHLLELDIITVTGTSLRDPHRTYSLKTLQKD